MNHASHRLRKANLEVSLKPFTDLSDQGLAATVRQVFDDWAVLLDAADACSVLLWVADGSEILDWAGDLDAAFEWARYIGFNNTEASPYGEPKPERRKAVPYRDDTPEVRYRDLARLVETLKAEGLRRGIPTQVGATFDPGPEFAPSLFKYSRHPEVVARGEDVGIGPIIAMVRHFSTLQADYHAYAAFPDGVPEGTSFGEFLGRQAQDFMTALGFDYLWLSNGFGFSSYAWSELGESFDGERFASERTPELRQRALGFWEDLSRHLAYPVQVRGTNHTAGIDIGADSVPALDVYEGGYISSPPPNSPWGPLNEDFGIELSGYMSRMAMLPTGATGYRFRFYANDPWFWQQPWWDFYHREPFDIHLPLSVARVDGNGQVAPPDEVNILSIDTCHGVLDPRCGREVSGHVATALESLPDAPGPLVWVYPFREYHEAMAADPTSINRPHFEDWYLTSAINAGLPLNTVVSTDNLHAGLSRGGVGAATLVVPAGALTPEVVSLLESHTSGGGSVLAYGSLATAPEAARALIGVSVADSGVEGVLERTGAALSDGLMPLMHTAHLSAGPVQEMVADYERGTAVLVSVGSGGRERAYATERRLGDGVVLWVRGSSPVSYSPPDDRGVRTHQSHDRSRFSDSGEIMVRLLDRVGIHISHGLRTATSGRVVQSIHRHDNAYWFTGYLPDTTTSVRLRLPEGAPLLQQRETWIEHGVSVHHLPKSFHFECRVLVDQEAAGRLSSRDVAPFPAHMTRGISVSGLDGARVTVLLPSDVEAAEATWGERVTDLVSATTGTDGLTWTREGASVVFDSVEGELTIMWRERATHR